MTCAACPAALLCMSGSTVIYLVMGRTGEYSDRSEWHVKAFVDDKQAAELAQQAQQWAADLKARSGCFVDNQEAQQNPYDPHCRIDYTGVEYYVVTVLFDGGVI